MLHGSVRCRSWHMLSASTRRLHRFSTCCTRDTVYVSPEWLTSRLDDVHIVDVRGSVETTLTSPGVEESAYRALKDSYLERHIPNATFWDWTADGVDPESPVPVQLDLNHDTFAAAAEEKGISTDAPVVVYDSGESGSMFACRLWWSLKVHGHPHAHILEGGWKAWTAYGGPTELAEPCPLKVMALFEGSLQLRRYASIADIAAASQASSGSNTQILDVRSAAQYQGSVRRSKHAGRVPGALSLPYKQLLGGDGTLLPNEKLRSRLEGAGLSLDKPVVLYCNGGVSACVAGAALEVLGTGQWSVYDGSWNEYGNQEEYPVECSNSAE